jgi:Mrp family chromosome partitioning ATPase
MSMSPLDSGRRDDTGPDTALSPSSEVRSLRQPKRVTPPPASPRRSGGLDVRPADALSSLPNELVTPLQYLVSRHLLTGAEVVPSPIAVVSGLRGEGVTTVAQALAVVLANDLDSNVCYVDLSWARSTDERGRRRDRSVDEVALPLVGQYELITGDASFDDAVHATHDPRVWMIAEGAVPEKQRHVMARSPQLVEVVEQLAQRFDHLVLDLPPVLVGSEGVALLRLAAAQILVVRHGVTTIQQLGAVDDELENVPSLGVVMNRFRSRVPRRIRHLFT